MIKEVIMPKLGQTVEEAVIEKWHKQEGDPVQKGEVLLEITTDKATLEVESFADGTLRKILAPEGATVPVNSVIAFVGDPSDEVPEAPAVPAPAPRPKALAGAAATAVPAGAPSAAPTAGPAPRSGRVAISPRAKARADELKVPYRYLKGSGPEGRIIEQDVLDYAERREALSITPTALNLAYARNLDVFSIRGSGPGGRMVRADVEGAEPPAVAAGPRRVPLTAMRRIIAERLSLSKSTIPHFYIDTEVDMSAAIVYRAELNQPGQPKVSFNDLAIRACALAFQRVPGVNASWGGDALLLREAVDIGLAVGIEEGLIVPVIRNVDQKDLRTVARESAELVEKARKKRLTPDEYGNASLTVSNLGMFGVDRVFPIINPGESCILGLGRIAEKVVVANGGIHIRNLMALVLACDHRIVDGVMGAQFLQAVKEGLETPSSLL